MNRREFLRTTAFTSLAAGLVTQTSFGEEVPTFKTKLQKARICGVPTKKLLEDLKTAGFHGVETTGHNVSLEEAEKVRKIAEETGMRVHSLLRGWVNFNDPNQDSVNGSITDLERVLAVTGAYGADAMLLVPCKVGGMKIPQPWELDIEFDPETCMLKKVVKGDNTPFNDYIKAQNYATTSSQSAVKRLIPAAEKAGVGIALENVWNNLWMMPDFFAAFIRSFKSKWVGSYLDLGNHRKYAPTENWVRALSDTIMKLHAKDYKVNEDGRSGSWQNLWNGSVDWIETRRALEEVGYNGFVTTECGGTVAEQSAQLDAFIAGVRYEPK